MKLSGRRIATLASGLTAAAGALLLATPAAASEGGTSFYLLGSGGPGAAVLPPLEGVYFDNVTYFYDGSATVERQFVIGGAVVAGLDATVIADFPTLLWVPTTDIGGATLALGATFPVGHPDVDASAVLIGPGGGTIGIERSDAKTVFGDPVASAMLGWKVGDKTSVQLATQVNIPIGHYREDRLANLAFNRWVVDSSVAATWHDPESGWDVSTKIGVSFNGENEYTDYDTGTELHLEASVEKTLSKAFSLGVQGYHFEQITGDSGFGARLGRFEGRVSALGVTGAYNFLLAKTPVSARLRAFQEFNAKNRLKGNSVFFQLTLPISMKLPPGAGAGG